MCYKRGKKVKSQICNKCKKEFEGEIKLKKVEICDQEGNYDHYGYTTVKCLTCPFCGTDHYTN
jgi:hypothetical protein